MTTERVTPNAHRTTFEAGARRMAERLGSADDLDVFGEALAKCVAPVFSRPNSPNLSLVGRWPPIWPSLAAVPSKSGRQAVLVGRAPLPLGSCREARGRAL